MWRSGSLVSDGLLIAKIFKHHLKSVFWNFLNHEQRKKKNNEFIAINRFVTTPGTDCPNNFKDIAIALYSRSF